MSKTILCSNLKGGVGKTTTAINLAACLSNLGFKTILCDLDHQANATKNLGMENADFTITNILLHEQKVRAFQVRENLVLIPCNKSFARFESEAKDRLRREEILRNALKSIQDKCDFIIIDSPPSIGLTTINAYTCSDYLIVPLEAQQFALDGLAEVMKLKAAIKSQLNENLELLGILFTRHRNNIILNKDLYAAMHDQYPDKTFDTVIRKNVALREAPHHYQTILDYDNNSNGAKDYMKLTHEILTKLGYERKKTLPLGE